LAAARAAHGGRQVGSELSYADHVYTSVRTSTGEAGYSRHKLSP
jgi:hypothetical protein